MPASPAPHGLGRRAFGAGLLCGAAGLLGGGCSGPPVGGRRVAARPVRIAPGVYMVQGAPGEPEAANQGRVGNAGFLVGEHGVLAVDSGVSYANGVDLIAAVAAVTDKPVRRVVITHTRQEFLFGVAAYRERQIEVVMHRRAALLMRARCERCLKNLKHVLGDDVMRGTRLLEPDSQIDGDADADTADIGRPARLLYFGHSSGPGDLAVGDAQSGVVFAGGLIDVRRIPEVQDGDLPGWHAALRTLAERWDAQVVPGHGPAADLHAAAAAENGYLRQLEARVRTLLDEGAALSEVPRSVDLPAYADWDGYGTLHRRNAAVLFVRLEREQLG